MMEYMTGDIVCEISTGNNGSMKLYCVLCKKPISSAHITYPISRRFIHMHEEVQELCRFIHMHEEDQELCLLLRKIVEGPKL